MSGVLVWLSAAWLAAFIPSVSSPQEHHEVEVTGDAVPLGFDSRRIALVIERRELTSLPIRSLAELLSHLANLDLVGRGEFQADVRAPGLNQEQVAVMVNGVPVNNAQTGHHNLALPIDLDQIERVEVLRGEISALNGSNGSGGVINIVTGARRGFRVERSAFDTTRLAADLAAGGWQASVGFFRTDGHLEGTDGRRYHFRGEGRGRMAGGRLHFWAGWVESRFGARNFYAPYPSKENLGRFLGALGWRRPMSASLTLSARLSSQFSRDDFMLLRDAPEVYRNRHRTRQHALELALRGGRRALSFQGGIQMSSDRIDSRGVRNGTAGPALGRRTRDLFTLFGEASGENSAAFINSGFRVLLGAIRDFSGRLLIGRRIGEHTRASLSLHRSFRIPTFTELYYEDISHRANPDLKAEHGLGAALAVKHSNGGREAGGRFFLNRTHHLIDWAMDPVRDLWTSANLGSATVYGVEIHGGLTFSSGFTRILYTRQETTLPADVSDVDLKYRFYIPRHSLSLAGLGDLGLLTLSGTLKMEIARGRPGTSWVCNLRIGRSFKGMEVYFEGRNLFNARMERVPGLPDPPRSTALGVRFDF